MTVVRGHGLQREGKPFHISTCPECTPTYEGSDWAPGYGGHGRCSCGANSPCLDSDAARKRWHKAHKADVLALITDGEVRARIADLRAQVEALRDRPIASFDGYTGTRTSLMRDALDQALDGSSDE